MTSATTRSGNRFARIGAICLVTTLSWQISNAPLARESKDQAQAMAQQLNAQAPYRLDDITRFDSASVDHYHLNFNFTILGSKAQEIHPILFYQQVLGTLRYRACTTLSTRRLLSAGRNLHYVYRDTWGQTISTINVSIDDC